MRLNHTNYTIIIYNIQSVFLLILKAKCAGWHKAARALCMVSEKKNAGFQPFRERKISTPPTTITTSIKPHPPPQQHRAIIE